MFVLLRLLKIHKIDGRREGGASESHTRFCIHCCDIAEMLNCRGRVEDRSRERAETDLKCKERIAKCARSLAHSHGVRECDAKIR